jgi:hypothetical protein
MSDLYIDNQEFTLTLIDKKKWTRLTVSVQDKDQNKYSISEIVQNLVKYIGQETKKEHSTIVSQIYPIMSQVLVPALTLTQDYNTAVVLMNGEIIKNSILDSMVISFLLLKYIQQKELKIITESQQLLPEEISVIKNREETLRTSSGVTQLLGVTPQQLLQTLMSNGEISQSELQEFISSQSGD